MAVAYSTFAKTVNRLAIGYAIQLTSVARDGGMREGSMKILCILCHPRTIQKYERDILAPGWDTELKKALSEEEEHFQDLSSALNNLASISETKSPKEFENIHGTWNISVSLPSTRRSNTELGNSSSASLLTT